MEMGSVPVTNDEQVWWRQKRKRRRKRKRRSPVELGEQQHQTSQISAPAKLVQVDQSGHQLENKPSQANDKSTNSEDNKVRAKQSVENRSPIAKEAEAERAQVSASNQAKSPKHHQRRHTGQHSDEKLTVKLPVTHESAQQHQQSHDSKQPLVGRSAESASRLHLHQARSVPVPASTVGPDSSLVRGTASGAPLATSNASGEPQGQEAQFKFILVTICLPLASCLMLSFLFCYVWAYCKKLARFKREQKHKSKVSKLKNQAKSGLRGISFIGGGGGGGAAASGGTTASGSGNKNTLDKRQLTINMETNELSSDDQSSSSYGSPTTPTSQAGLSKLVNPLADKVKFVRGFSGHQQTEAKKQAKSMGFLKYSLSYDFNRSILFVNIIQARDLPSMDLCGTSDPYVKVYLTPNGVASPLTPQPQPGNNNNERSCFKTKIHKRTLNPMFNEQFQFQVAYADLVKQSLNLIVYDYDRLSKHDEIGLVSIRMCELDLAQLHEEQWAKLQRSSQPNSDGQLGDICISLRYVPTAGKLTVVVLEARKLKKMDLAGLSDPYVKLVLTDENGKRLKKKKTSIKKCTLNPHYNESFSFEIPFEQVQKVQLHATVIDYDRIGTSEPIGRIILGCDTTSGDTELRHWMDMLASPRRPIAQWHSLKQMTSKLETNTNGNCGGGLDKDGATESASGLQAVRSQPGEQFASAH